MPDAPSNLPFDPLDEAPMTPPRPPAATSSAVPIAEPIVPPARPVMPTDAPPPSRPVAPIAPSAPQPMKSVMPPQNASVPEDVFAGIETLPSAPRSQAQPSVAPPPLSSDGHGKGIALAIFGLVALIGVAGGTWWYFFRPAPVAPLPQTTGTRDLPVLPPPAQEPSVFDPVSSDTAPVQIVPLPEPVTTPPPGTSIPVPGSVGTGTPVIPTAPDAVPSSSSSSTASSTSVVTGAPSQPAVQFDTDGDGLTDVREQELGTNSSRFDTDGDTLGDGQEVMTYGTNPLNVDTDSDGFPDGVEIQNGFNPRGTGRCSAPDCRL